jgi:hypothetical protein
MSRIEDIASQFPGIPEMPAFPSMFRAPATPPLYNLGDAVPGFTPAPATKIEHTLIERGKRYGDFSDHAFRAQELQDAMRSAPGWENLDANKRQALTVIADKIARILTGDPEYKDNWHDIQGYAKLAEDRCTSS